MRSQTRLDTVHDRLNCEDNTTKSHKKSFYFLNNCEKATNFTFWHTDETWHQKNIKCQPPLQIAAAFLLEVQKAILQQYSTVI